MMTKFYSVTYLEKNYPKKFKEILVDIFDEYGENGWDLFTSFKNKEEVEDFIKDFI